MTAPAREAALSADPHSKAANDSLGPMTRESGALWLPGHGRGAGGSLASAV